MHKSFTQFLAAMSLALFLGGQAVLWLHTAEHGVLEHSHAGEQCQHYLVLNHLCGDIPDVGAFFVSLAFSKTHYSADVKTIYLKQLTVTSLARAPPVVS